MFDLNFFLNCLSDRNTVQKFNVFTDSIPGFYALISNIKDSIVCSGYGSFHFHLSVSSNKLCLITVMVMDFI